MRNQWQRHFKEPPLDNRCICDAKKGLGTWQQLRNTSFRRLDMAKSCSCLICEHFSAFTGTRLYFIDLCLSKSTCTECSGVLFEHSQVWRFFSEKQERQLLRQSEEGSHLLLNEEMTFLVNNEVWRRSQYTADGVWVRTPSIGGCPSARSAFPSWLQLYLQTLFCCTSSLLVRWPPLSAYLGGSHCSCYYGGVPVEGV